MGDPQQLVCLVKSVGLQPADWVQIVAVEVDAE